MHYFVQYIWNYSNVINYNTAHSKTVHKYYLKAFYNRMIKKKYDLQIWQQNLCYINIIAMKDIIIPEKIREKKELPVGILDTIMLATVSRVSSTVDLAKKYQ